ncbi:hypothetical protein IWX50DRAFT_448954 [Phyllosticta citricarpa]
MRAALVVDLAAATLSRTFHLLSPRLSSGCLPTPKPKKSSSCCKWSVRRGIFPALGGTTFLIKSASRADRTARYKGAAVQQTIEHGTVARTATLLRHFICCPEPNRLDQQEERESGRRRRAEAGGMDRILHKEDPR